MMELSSFIKSKKFLWGLAIAIQIFMYIPYFFQVPEPVKAVESNLLTMGLIIATFAMFVGVYTVTMREISRTRKKVKGWPFSVWMLFVLWFMVVTGVTLGQSHQSFQFFQNSRGFRITSCFGLLPLG